MDSSIKIKRKDVPNFKAIKSFPKAPQIFLAYLWLSFPTILLLALLVEIGQYFIYGKAIITEESAPVLIALIPILLIATRYFSAQNRIRKMKKAGTPIVGAFFGADALLWCVKENACYFIPQQNLKAVNVRGTGTSGNTSDSYVVDSIELIGADFGIKIFELDTYEFVELIHYLRRWRPEATFYIDPGLYRYKL